MFEKLEEIRRKYDEVKARLADPEFVQDHRAVREAQKTLTDFEPIIALMEEYRQVRKELEGARELVESLSPGDELHQMAAAERAALSERLPALEQELKMLLLPKDPNDSRNVFLEIRAGTGGDEAALFAGELFRMYQRYAERRRWKVEIVDRDDTGIGGIKTITVLIEGEGAYSRLKYEGGAHRVQRVPRPSPRAGSTPRRRPSRSCRRPRTSTSRWRTRTSGSTASARRVPAARVSTRPTRPCA